LTPFNAIWNKIPFNLTTHTKYSGLENNELISLSGIRGIIKKNSTEIPKLEVNGNYPQMTIRVSYDNVVLFRRLDLENCVIYNQLFETTVKRQGNGTKILFSQVELSRELGFNTIYCYAMGNCDSIFNGYITWGKLGYTMYQQDDIDEFDNILRGNKASKTSQEAYFFSQNLFALLKTKEGCDFWTINGVDWFGLFDTDQTSQNYFYLKEYMARKKLQIT
jgi:hypothetical protein